MSDGQAPGSPATWRGTRLAVLLVILVAVVAVWLLIRTQPASRTMEADDAAEIAVQGLLAKTPPAGREALLLRLAGDPSPAKRHAAVASLDAYRTQSALSAVQTAFADSSSEVRQTALDTLPQMDNQRGARLLLQALGDTDTEVREKALILLRRVADRRAVPLLIPLVDDPVPDVQLLAMRQLQKLTGQGFAAKNSDPPAKRHAVAAQWRRWWVGAQRAWDVPADSADVRPVFPSRSDRASDFALKDLDGRPARLGDARGRVVLLNFWATWCPPCQEETPDLESVWREFEPKGIAMLGVAVGEESSETVRSWAKKHAVTYRLVLGDDAVATSYEAHEIPVTILLDRRGNVRYRWDGATDRWTLRAALRRLLVEDRRR